MKKLAAICASFLAANPVFADGHDGKVKAYVTQSIVPWIGDPILVRAVAQQNAKTAGLSQDQIDTLDLAWRGEVGSNSTPTIDAVLVSPASDFLRSKLDASGGMITEVFAMDARGLNVAASGITSDYWQGDEDKFAKTFPDGPGAVFVDQVEFDESSQSYLVQVSLTLTDPATGQPIGAVTVGLNAESLF